MQVGEMTFRFFMLLCRLDPVEQARLWLDEQGRLQS
jgi:hypothetical protein